MKKFQRVMNALPDNIRAPIRAEIFHQAAVLRGDIAAAAPGGATGNLKRSVRVTPGTRSRMAALVRAGGELTTIRRGITAPQSVGGHRVQSVADSYDYAIAIEFGTRNIPAQPFFFSTYRAKKSKLRQAIKNEAIDAINKIVPLNMSVADASLELQKAIVAALKARRRRDCIGGHAHL